MDGGSAERAWFEAPTPWSRSRRESESEKAGLVRQLVRSFDPVPQLEPGDDDEKERAEGTVDACDESDVDAIVRVGRIGSGARFFVEGGARKQCGIVVDCGQGSSGRARVQSATRISPIRYPTR